MRKIGNTCLEYRCVKCCLNTEMLLSSSDIRQIRSLGFSENFFIVKRNGKRQLKNSAGRCIFHNGRRCTIYDDRPEGCRLYPIIFREDTGEAVLDSYCPHHAKFQVTPSISSEVIKLVRRLDVETKRRLRSGER
jgi:Fe-S-cluster containining protein